MYRKHRDILSMWVVATLLACGLAAPSRGWAQQGGFALGEPIRLGQRWTHLNYVAGYWGEPFGPLDRGIPSWSPDGSKILLLKGSPGDVDNAPEVSTYDLYVVNVDGTNPVLLGKTSRIGLRSTVWSPDGSKILFPRAREREEDLYDLYVMNADGTNPTLLGNMSLAYYDGYVNVQHKAVWSPDGSKIVFPRARERGEELYDLYVVNTDGTNPPVLLTANLPSNLGPPERQLVWPPRWSPDGTKIAFEAAAPSSSLFVINADGTNLVRLRSDSHWTLRNPRWTPDGTKILLTASPRVYPDNPNLINTPREIAVINADGTNLIQLTKTHVPLSYETDSPDGSKIAFLSLEEGSSSEEHGLYVINADGTNFIRLMSIETKYEYDAVGFEWSQDGTKIIFWHSVDRCNQPSCFLYRTIYVVNADGTKPVKVLRSLDEDLLSWSPNGTRFAFSYDDGGVTETSVVNADGTTLVRLSGFNYNGWEPYGGWSPDGTKIAFSSRRFGLVVTNADGTNAVPLYESLYNIEWSPDGSKILGSGVNGYFFVVSVSDAPPAPPLPPEHGNTRDEATVVAPDSTTAGDLTYQDVDYFQIDVTEPGRLMVETTGTTDTVGYLQGAQGQTLAGDDDAGTETNFRIGRDVTPGRYYVAVVGGKGRTATGAYTLDVRLVAGEGAAPAEHGNIRAHATRVDVNTATAGALEQRGDVDYFRVTLPQAGMLTVETTGDTDTVGYFGGADGRWLSRNDDQDGDVNFRIVRQVSAGTYYVAVVGGAGRTVTGAYTFHVRFTADGAAADHGDTRERATRVDVNTQTDGALERAGDVDYFRVAVLRAGRLTVETTGTTDTFGYVGGAAGGWLMQDDDGGTERNFRIARDVAAGTYYIAVVGKNRTATGPYTLAVRLTDE